MKTLLPLWIALFFPAVAGAKPAPGLFDAGGRALPIVESDADLMVTGDVITARVTQTFENDGKETIAAEYLFPLPHDAAVHAMTLEVAGKSFEAKIAKVEEAKKEFQAAAKEGKTAALLEQQRANVFTQHVANIPPGAKVKVKIRYAATVPREDGTYRLHFPMAVGARYSNGANGIQVPELQKPLPPQIAGEKGTAGKAPKISVRVRLAAGLPIRHVASTSHAIEVDTPSPSRREVMLARGRVPDDRDFVLEYRLGGERVAAGMVLHEDPRGAFYSLLVEPPSTFGAEEIRARELVFVIDASCSMEGAPLDAAKRLIDTMLGAMRPSDRYRVIVFGSSAEELHRGALAPTAENLAATRRALASLGTMGGTEIELGIKAALNPEIAADRLRMVMFLTDAYIGDEASVMATIKKHRKTARIFSFGIGSSVNRWLIEEMAIAGHGISRIVGVDEDPAPVVEDLAKRLESPLLTDAWIDWGEAAMTDATPAGTFDLFAGAPMRIYGRAPKGLRPEKLRASLVGTIGGKEVRLPIGVQRLEGEQGAEAIPVLWARAQVAEKMRQMTDPARVSNGGEKERAQLVEEITNLGLTFGLTTQWTAFVAISDVTAPVAESKPVAFNPPGGSFFGSSTPEPATWAAMALLATGAARALRRRKRES